MAPMALLQSLKSYYSKTEDQPIISSRTAALLSIAYTALYVLPFYLSPLTRPSPTLPRDSPSVIRARIRSVTFSCALCSLSTIYILSVYDHVAHAQVFHLLGWYPISLLDALKPLLLTASLFAGPLFEKGVVEGGWRGWIRGRDCYECLSSWSGWRNYVAGPITEELLFRSLLLPLALISHHPSKSPLPLILLTPLYFGIAHIHHFYEFVLTHPRTPYAPALLLSLFQFAYTTVFGWYAAFVYLRTGSLLGVVLCHAFCNWMGLPRLWGRVGEEGVGVGRRENGGKMGGRENVGKLGEETVLGVRRAGGTERGVDTAKSPHSKRSGKVARLLAANEDGRLGLGWTVAYYSILVGGVWVFWEGFWVLTRSGNGLVDWGGW